MRTILLLHLAFLISVPVLAQSVEPALAVTTDKATYSLFEPILVEVCVTNPSDEPQQLYKPDWGMVAPRTGYRVYDPSGRILWTHATIYQEFVLFPTTSVYEPGQTRCATLNLPLIHPILAAGTYTLTVENSDQGTVLTSLSFIVERPTGADPQVVDTLVEATRRTFDATAFFADRIPDSLHVSTYLRINVPAILEDVIASTPVSSPLREWATYLRGLYYDLKAKGYNMISTEEQVAAREQAAAFYEAFLDAYPESGYAPAARYGEGGLLFYGGGEPNATESDDDPPPTGDCGQLPAEADIAFETTSVWTTGYNAELQITNTGTEPIRGWTLDFALDASINSLWNGQLTGSPPQYTVIDAGHNHLILPGQSTTVGFQVLHNTVVEPTGYALNAVDCATQAPSVDIAFETTSVWGTGYNAELRITNTGAEAIRGWRLAFDLAAPITSLWNGTLGGSAPQYTITDAGHNAIIAPGQTVTIGFQVASDTVVEPSDYDFQFWAVGP